VVAVVAVVEVEGVCVVVVVVAVVVVAGAADVGVVNHPVMRDVTVVALAVKADAAVVAGVAVEVVGCVVVHAVFQMKNVHLKRTLFLVHSEELNLWEKQTIG
jgi:hypothetical protein